MMTAIKSVLVTGANRGIGLELVHQMLTKWPHLQHVFAACRAPELATELRDIQKQFVEKLKILKLDVCNDDDIKAAVDSVHTYTDSLSMLINNAGVTVQGSSLKHTTREQMRHVHEVNAISPLIITQRFLELLKRGGNSYVINVSSELGSITNTSMGGSYAYKASKASLNMIGALMGCDMVSDQRGVRVVQLHPGWVRTRMGSEKAPLTPAHSVELIMGNVLDRLTHITSTGQGEGGTAALFVDLYGNTLPW